MKKLLLYTSLSEKRSLFSDQLNSKCKLGTTSIRGSMHYFALLLLLSLSFVRCSFMDDIAKIESSIDSLKLSISTPEFKNIIHLEFLDAKTQLPVTTDFKVKITGVDADKVYNNIGENLEEYIVKNGMIDLVVDPNLDSVYLESNPLRINITPIATDYLSHTQQVNLKNEKLKFVSVPLVGFTNGNTDGIKVSVQQLTPTYNADKKITQVITQQIDGVNTTIEIPSGTALKNATGTSLSGNISSKVVYFSGSDSIAQSVIENQLTGEAQLHDGSVIETKLISAGMFSAQLTVGDQTVKTIEGEGLKLRTRISDELYNPEEGRMVLEGDIIPMWSKDDGSGKWVLEKQSVVKKDSEGLYLEDIVHHLSSWNWDWFTSASCPYGLKINWSLSGVSSANVIATVTLNSSKNPYKTTNLYVYNRDYTQLMYTPRNMAGNIVFKERNPVPGRKLVFSPASISFSDLCTMSAKTVNVMAVYDNVLTVNFNLSAKSEDKSSKIIIRPNLYIYYKAASAMYWSAMCLKNGMASITMIMGQDYDVFGCFGQYAGYGKLRIDPVGTDKLQVKLTPTIGMSNNEPAGSVISLAPITRPANNIINVEYTALLPSDVFNSIQ